MVGRDHFVRNSRTHLVLLYTVYVHGSVKQRMDRYISCLYAGRRGMDTETVLVRVAYCVVLMCVATADAAFLAHRGNTPHIVGESYTSTERGRWNRVARCTRCKTRYFFGIAELALIRLSAYQSACFSVYRSNLYKFISCHFNSGCEFTGSSRVIKVPR